MSLTNAQIGKAVLAFLAVLACIALVLAVVTMPRPANGAEMPMKYQRVPPGVPCVTINATLERTAQWAMQMQIDVISAIGTEPNGDKVVIFISPSMPTVQKLRFVDGCLFDLWEEPKPGPQTERPPVDGTPA